MSDQLHKFRTGPYNVLEFTTKTKEGKAIIDVNNGELGRITIENLETVEKLKESLEKIENHLKETQRRQEEL